MGSEISIRLTIERNNLHGIETFVFFKWILKTFAAVLIVTNARNIVMGVFDVARHVVSNAAGVIIGDTALDIRSGAAEGKKEPRPVPDKPGRGKIVTNRRSTRLTGEFLFPVSTRFL